jgi:hypothetical protein
MIKNKFISLVKKFEIPIYCKERMGLVIGRYERSCMDALKINITPY